MLGPWRMNRSERKDEDRKDVEQAVGIAASLEGRMHDGTGAEAT
jgi:hypothetical protein